MGLMYTASFETQSESAEVDLFEIVAPSDAVVAIHSIRLGQETEAGDTEAEQLKVELIKGHATSGSGGNANTPNPLQTGFPAAGSTVEDTNTTVASTGSPINLLTDAFNIQIGWLYQPTPEERIILSPSERLVVRIPAGADAISWSCSMTFEEIGG